MLAKNKMHSTRKAVYPGIIYSAFAGRQTDRQTDNLISTDRPRAHLPKTQPRHPNPPYSHQPSAHKTTEMPPVRTSRTRKPPPAGFDDIEDTLLEFSNKMKDAENAPHEGKKKHEMLWPVFQISHQRMLPARIPAE